VQLFRRRIDPEELETFQPKLWGVLVGLALLAAYIVAFVVENNQRVHVHFVIATAAVSLIWVILLSALIGLLGGLLVSQLYRRRRRRAGQPGV
jgi:uncharacterized integral membrane protein